MDKISLQEKFGMVSEYWSPKIIGEINDSCVKIAKLKGEFLWHTHDNEDEMFYVFQGALTIKLRDKDIRLSAGECVIIPKGVEHMPVADQEGAGDDDRAEIHAEHGQCAKRAHDQRA